jgi:hypothetical protein
MLLEVFLPNVHLRRDDLCGHGLANNLVRLQVHHLNFDLAALRMLYKLEVGRVPTSFHGTSAYRTGLPNPNAVCHNELARLGPNSHIHAGLP